MTMTNNRQVLFGPIAKFFLNFFRSQVRRKLSAQFFLVEMNSIVNFMDLRAFLKLLQQLIKFFPYLKAFFSIPLSILYLYIC